MRRLFKIFLGYLLTICLILNNLPMVANADKLVLADNAEITENETTNGISSESDVASEEPHVVGELVEKREVNIKHFRMSDGSITAAVYPQEIHYEDETGALVDIDNSFVDAQDDSDDVFANSKNEFQVKFMKKSNKNKLYTLNKGKEKITVSIEGVSKVKAEVTKVSPQTEEIKNTYGLSDIGSTVVYSDIFENVDLEYTVVSKEIKENIVLKEEVDFNSVVYHYKFGNHLEAISQDEQTILLQDKNSGEPVFEISAPVMWDSTGNYYDNLTLTIIETKNGKATVELCWDGTILEKAVYPVTIDPVMSFSVNRLEIQDTHILAAYPTTNYNVTNHIRVRNNGYALLQFPTPVLNSGDKIVHAKLVLYPYGNYDNSLDIYTNENSYNPALYINVHKILRSWDETTATYQNIAPDNGFYDSTVQDYRVVDGDDSFYTWDITRLANEWVEGHATNYGILLKYDQPPSDGSVFDSFFCSTNGKYIDSAAWPQILYQYVNTTGIEDYYSYHTQDLGYAGTGYVNDLTGNLTIINPVLKTGGSLMPITVSLIYNTNNVNAMQTPYGAGWKLNWTQKIDWSVKSNYDDTQYVKYTDADGTNHFFTTDSTTGIWTDEINPDRKIYFIESTGDYKMTDSSGISMYFTRNGTLNEWYLYKIEDNYGNYIMLTLNSSNLNRVDKVYSSSGNKVDFVYNEHGFLTGIQYYDDNQTKTITIGYNNYVATPNNCISNIYYSDGKYVQYHYYDTTKYMSKAVDISGQNIAYNYKWTSPLRVNYVAEYSSDSQIGGTMTMTYEPTATVFNDVTNNRKYLYTFAQNGTLKSAVDITTNDGNGYGQYYEYNNGNTDTTTGSGNLTFVSKTQKSTVNVLPNHSFEANGYHSFVAWNETTGTASGTYTSEKSHIGARSYKITRPSSSNSFRAIGFYYLYLEGGKTYTLSAYVNTKDMVSNGKGASLLFIDSEKLYESEYITETTDKWQRLSLKFTTKTSEYVSICMNMCEATGSVYFDNIQLEEGDLSDYNLLENAGFEDDNSSSPRGWNASTNIGSISETHKIAGNRAAYITGSITKHFHYMQSIYVSNGKKDDTYVASAFAKATSVPADGWKFTILVRFKKNGNTINEQNILFNSYTTEWQKIAGVAKATGDYDTVTFWLLYYNNSNSIYFDNAQLIKDTFGTTYTYDSNGNLMSAVDLQGKAEYTFKYDGNNQLIKQNSLSGSKILYTYNQYGKEQQLEHATSGGITTAYTYDAHGNAITSITSGSELVNGSYYYIENVYYSKYLDAINLGTTDGTNVGSVVFSKNSAQRWKLIDNSDGTYSFSPECAPDKLLSVEEVTLANGTNLALYSSGAKSYQKFKLAKKHGNIYCMDIAENSNYAVDCNGSNVYIYSTHHGEIQQFAFILAEGNESAENPVITSSATYSSNGEYMTSMTDSRGNSTSYEYNEDRGYLTSETNAEAVTTDYNYNSSELLEKVSVENAIVNYDYDAAKRLSSIISPSGTEYGFIYDNFGSNTGVTIGSRSLSSYVYDNAKGLLDYIQYGNGTLIDYSYDNLGRQTEVIINQTLRYKKIYDGYSRLLQIEDFLRNSKIKYEYDILGRTTSERLIDTLTNQVYAQFDIRYDDTKNRVSGYDVNLEGISNVTDFVYGENKVAPDIITSVKYNDTKMLSYGYDSLNRLLTRTIATTTPFVTEYGYLEGATANTTTTLVKTVKNGNDTLEYTYDVLGNITSVSKNGSVIESYTYDNLNQLKTVTCGTDTYEYTYDNGGNILSVKRNGEIIKTYTYGDGEWKDLLTAYNGENITYDTIGNPLTYRAGMNFAWTDGRKLSSITKGTDNISYTYDANGLRTTKTVNGTTTEYYWLNGMLQGQKTGNAYILFLYDENGSAYGFILQNGTEKSYYYYEFNLQGDIIGIIDSTGNKVVEYSYDEWGKILSITGTLAETIGQQNPLRYRGYYYDAETGFYLTGTRYYDPEIGRFINADSVISGTGESVQGYNLFAYCFNNPVNMSDPSGNWPKWATKLVAAVAVFAVVAAVAAVTVATAGAGTAIAAVAVGAAKGAAIGFAVGAASGAAIGYATTGTLEGTLNGMADGALSGSISGAITGGVNGYSNYSSAVNFLKSNGANPKEVLSSYKGTPKVQTLKTDTTVYRTWGGTTQELGHWVSPNNYGSSARNLLSLPAGNTMTHTSSFLLPKGTTVLAGKAAPLFGQSGGGVQWWISVLG